MQDEGPWPSPTAFVPAVISDMQEDSLALPVALCGGAWNEKRGTNQVSYPLCSFDRFASWLVLTFTLCLYCMCEVIMSNFWLLKHAQCFRMLCRRLFCGEALLS